MKLLISLRNEVQCKVFSSFEHFFHFLYNEKKKGGPSMVHLHARSCYSLLESSLRVERLVDQSAALGYRHVALTDKDAIEF